MRLPSILYHFLWFFLVCCLFCLFVCLFFWFLLLFVCLYLVFCYCCFSFPSPFFMFCLLLCVVCFSKLLNLELKWFLKSRTPICKCSYTCVMILPRNVSQTLTFRIELFHVMPWTNVMYNYLNEGEK